MSLRKVAVIGLGLIGGSFAAAVKARGLAQCVSAYAPREDHLALAKHLGYIDEIADDVKSCVKDADLVMIAAPVSAFEEILKILGELPQDWFAADVVISDVASVKSPIAALAFRYLKHLTFIPGHPIAGSEKSGITAVNPRLFENHIMILTVSEPAKKNGVAAGRSASLEMSNSLELKKNKIVRAIQVLTDLWKGLGARVRFMQLEQHDQIFAVTSHLPHALAFSLVDTLAGNPAQQEIFEFAAGGFRDFTRIAASDPMIWRDVFFSNKEHLLDAIEQFCNGLQQLKQGLENNDNDAVLGILTRSQVARQHFQTILERRAFTALDHNKREHFRYMNPEESFHFLVQPGGQCSGDIKIPGDKSISHRSIMFGALANGVTEIDGFLEGEDALATLQAFRDMGVVIEGPKDGRVTIHGVGLHGLKSPPGDIYVGNSGTTIRLLLGILAAQSFKTRLHGDHSLMKRPMGRVAEPLVRMGAQIMTSKKGTPPVEVIPAMDRLRGIDYQMPVVSAQVKSAILLAGLYAQGETIVREIGPARDHTERMLKAFGVQLDVQGSDIHLLPGQVLTGTQIVVPSDVSSAAFFIVGASIANGSSLLLRNVGINPTRTGVLEILRLMGANISLEHERFVGGEPVADLRITAAQLRGIDIPVELVPLAIDEFPAIFIAAACAKGITKLSGAEELRIKESDRISAMATGLTTLGVHVEPQPDGIIIHGKGEDLVTPVFGGGVIETFGDHRIAMAFAMAGLRAKQVILVKDVAHVATSFPGFLVLAQMAGMSLISTTKEVE